MRALLFFALLLVPCLAAAQTERIRIMAANTTSGNGQDYQPPGIRIFQGLRPDIVLIQEFNYGNKTPSDIRTFVDTAFGTEFHYYRENGSGHIPNGIISRHPIIAAGEWLDVEVPDRDFAWARIDVPGDKDLWAVSVHLKASSATTQNLQAQEIVRQVLANIPTGDFLVIGGDFNTSSRSSSAIITLRQVVTSDNTPVDQSGNYNTNANRNSPYDWVMPDNDLNQYLTPVVIDTVSMPNGLVFDSRVFIPLSIVSPVLLGDSGVLGMQHMAVVKDFLVPTGATGTPTPTPEPTITPTPTPIPSLSGAIFINEIHYDDDGTDENEGVEVAGPAGTNLTGWSIVPYNGSGGSQYEPVVTLSESLPSQQGCMGTLWVPILGLQNGAPDGIALVNAEGQVVQFISYEGSFAATNGPANGMFSIDIGVEETNSTPSGLSLQLQGAGNKYEDFAWAPEASGTAGQPNNAQSFVNCAVTPTPTPLAGGGWSIQ